MKAEERELFRIALLAVLDANLSPWGINAARLSVLVAPHGFQPAAEETRAELAYLEDKGFVAVPSKAISPENKTWRITAAGRDWLAEHE